MARAVGQPLPDIEVLHCRGTVFEARSLEELLGERGLVLVFHGFSFGGLAWLWWTRFQNRDLAGLAGMEVVAVSRDGPYAQNAFIRATDGPFTMISDVDGALVDRFGLRRQRPDMAGVDAVCFATYVVDGDGEIRHAWVAADATDRASLSALEAALLSR